MEGFDLFGFVGVGGGFDDEGLGEADAGFGFDGGDFDSALEVEDGLDEVFGGTFGLVVVGEEEEGFAIEGVGLDDFFEDCKRMELDITEQFKLRYNTNHLGMGVREKMASGILNVYEKATGKTLAPMPFEIDMPVIKVTA